MAGLLGKIGFGKSTDPLQFARQADGLRLKGSVKKAILLCQDGLKLRPDHVTGYAILARCLVDDHQPHEAREALAEALRHEPHNIAVLTELGSLLEADDNIPQALNYYRQALAIDPLNRRVRSLVQRIAPSESGEQIDDALQETPGDEPMKAPGAFIPPHDEFLDASQPEPEKAEQTGTPRVEAPTPVSMADQVENAPTIEVQVVSDGPTPIHEKAEAASAAVQRISGLWIAELFGDNLPASDAPHPGLLADGSVQRFYADAFAVVLDEGDPNGATSEQSRLEANIGDGLPVEPTTVHSPIASVRVGAYTGDLALPEAEESVTEEQGNDGEELAPTDEPESMFIPDVTLALEPDDDAPILAVLDEGGPETADGNPVPGLVWEDSDESQPDIDAETSPGDAPGDQLDVLDETESVFTTEQSLQAGGAEEAQSVTSSGADQASEAVVPEIVPSLPRRSVFLDQFFTGKMSPLPVFTKPEIPKKTGAEPGAEPSVAIPGGGEPDKTSETELAESMARLEQGRRKPVPNDRDALAMEQLGQHDDNLPSEEEPDAGEVIPTATLAELYVRQGLLDRAISVYLAMVARDPTNPDVHKRLAELSDRKTGQETS